MRIQWERERVASWLHSVQTSQCHCETYLWWTHKHATTAAPEKTTKKQRQQRRNRNQRNDEEPMSSSYASSYSWQNKREDMSRNNSKVNSMSGRKQCRVQGAFLFSRRRVLKEGIKTQNRHRHNIRRHHRAVWADLFILLLNKLHIIEREGR